MHAAVFSIIEWIWVAVGAVWLAAALRYKKVARREALASRLLHLLILVVALALLFPDLAFVGKLPAGPLDRRFVPDSPAVAWAGVVLAAAGCAFAIWARMLLGGNWSGSVTVKQDHQLMRKGPYAIVRHPIYSGFLLGLAGTALALGEWRGILGLLLAFVAWFTKSRAEETFMTVQFGAAYGEYQRHVKALIPFVL